MATESSLAKLEQAAEACPGHPITEQELLALGFVPLVIEPGDAVTLPKGTGRNWNTIGVVPDGPGHYLFTVEENGTIRVVYVGLTEHLWMVTIGRRPGKAGRGGKPQKIARPGQHYGRPAYAGETRKHVNMRVAEQLARGRIVRHWVRVLVNAPTGRAALRAVLAPEESRLMQQWRLREIGWNRKS